MSYPVVVVEEIFVLVLIFFWCPVYIALIVRVTYMDTPLMMLKHDGVELLIYESHGNIRAKIYIYFTINYQFSYASIIYSIAVVT